MKFGIKFVLLLAMCLSAFGSFSQPVVPSGSAGKFELASQLWNTPVMGNSGTNYYNTIGANGLGVQLDSTTSTNPLYLTTSRYTHGHANSDTFLVSPLSGYGTLSLFATALKVSGTDTITFTPICSNDGFAWSTISGSTAVSLYPTSLTIPVQANWTVATKAHRYYGIKAVNNAGGVSSVFCSYYLNKPYWYINQQ